MISFQVIEHFNEIKIFIQKITSIYLVNIVLIFFKEIISKVIL